MSQVIPRVTNPTIRNGAFPLPLKKVVKLPPTFNRAEVRLRIAKAGNKGFERYHLVAIPSNMRRDALPLEKLGEWDGVPKMRVLPNAVDWAGHSAERFEKRVEWNESRIMWWLNEGGAKPTTKVVWMLEKAGLLVKGAHPWKNGIPRPFSGDAFTGHWPEYDPQVAANTPGAALKGTQYLVPPQAEVERLRMEEKVQLFANREGSAPYVPSADVSSSPTPVTAATKPKSDGSHARSDVWRRSTEDVPTAALAFYTIKPSVRPAWEKLVNRAAKGSTVELVWGADGHPTVAVFGGESGVETATYAKEVLLGRGFGAIQFVERADGEQKEEAMTPEAEAEVKETPAVKE